MFELTYPANSDDIECVRALMTEYATSLGLDLAYQDFGKELAELPGKYAPPSGALLLAKDGLIPAGCVALRRIDHETCEMKRLFVTSSFRGCGLGKILVKEIIRRAETLGYTAIKLDTILRMKEAVNLYYSMGFRRTDAYVYSPAEDAVYFELPLST